MLSKSLIIVFSFAFISQVAYYFYNKEKRKRVTSKQEINEVLMFSYGTDVLKKSKYSRVMINKSLDRLLYFLNSPKKSLDICMYVLTNSDVTNVILKLNLRGVKVRLIIDADMAYATGSHVRKIEKHGIAVRWMKSSNIMHHKFCLIDAHTDDESVTPVVLMGSLNWTNQALSGNWEDVAVTSQRQLVHQYSMEFERLWTLFKPVV